MSTSHPPEHEQLGQSPTMRDSRNVSIGVLAATAAVLFVGLMLIQSRPGPAWADGMTVSGGEYTLAVGGLNQADEEYVYVLDASAQKMIVYRFDAMKQQIEIVTGVDLAKIREESADKTPDKLPPKLP